MDDKLTTKEIFKITGSLHMTDKICEFVDRYFKERFEVELTDEDKCNFFPMILSMVLPITMDDVDNEMGPKEYYKYLNDFIDRCNKSGLFQIDIGIKYSEDIEDDEEDIKS